MYFVVLLLYRKAEHAIPHALSVFLNIHDYCHRTVVAAHDISEDLRIPESVTQSVRNYEIVDSPSCVLLSGAKPV